MRMIQSSSQRGAMLAWTALFMVVLMGCAALVIDLGLGWTSRRNLVTTTDAAALAAAQEYALGGTGCDAVASNYVSLNAPGATMTACDPLGTNAVTVDAEQNITTSFAQVLGLTDFDTESSSTAKWGQPNGATGLRPFGLCSEAPGMQQFLANPQATQTHRIDYNKASPDQCGGNNVPGNWGTIDFDGGANSNQDTKDWVENGYDDAVYSGTLGGTCGAEPYACYEGDTGATTGANKETKDLMDSGMYFGLPIFDYAIGNGAGSTFHLIGFARVRIVDFKFNGAEDQRFITLQFEPGIITGSCCNPGGPPTNAKAIAICAVDRKNLGAC
ncbi:MAG: pilus assembly protein TadG-related protein [Acidimicrobiales bacterium]